MLKTNVVGITEESEEPNQNKKFEFEKHTFNVNNWNSLEMGYDIDAFFRCIFFENIDKIKIEDEII